MPGDRRRFDPVDEEEAAWCHMERSVNATLPLLMKFGHEFDYGSPTELELEHVAVFGELVQRPAPSQPWHGGKVVVLARNDPLRGAAGAPPSGSRFLSTTRSCTRTKE